MIGHLCVIGVGLIGGSFARALRDAGQVETVTGCGRNEEHLQRAVELGVIDRYDCQIEKAVAEADLIFISVPLGAMRAVFEAMRGHLKAGAIVTDAGSVKASVVRDLEQVFASVPDFFVPGHPIAGTENSGVDASFSTLYQNRKVILTPLETTNTDALATVSRLWQATGAHVTQMTVVHHDAVLAATSHLPHVLAFALVESLTRLPESDDVFQYAAGGFRDFTRIASSDPVMWRDICLANKQAIVAMIDQYALDLGTLKSAIEDEDSEQLQALFLKAKQTRDAFIKQV